MFLSIDGQYIDVGLGLARIATDGTQIGIRRVPSHTNRVNGRSVKVESCTRVIDLAELGVTSGTEYRCGQPGALRKR